MNPIEEGDLIENLDLPLHHAEKFLLAKESRIDFKMELICGNGNRWGFPKNYVNHGDVVVAYTKLRESLTEADDSGIDVGDTTSGNVHVSVFHGEHRASIIIDPDHATRVAERLWDCAATGRAVQMENQPQDSIP